MKRSQPHHDNSRAANTAPDEARNRLRIIGGRWRGTKLNFPALAAIRPTPDRVRETVFNWLQQSIVEARCLDLFAGSGALGLEALSRGASHVVFVDREPAIARYLRDTLTRLQCSEATIHSSDAHSYLQRMPTPFDVVFLDPPFAASEATDLLQRLCLQLDRGWLKPHAWIYIECPASLGTLQWPPHWRVHRSKHTGQVGYHLVQYTQTSTAA